jgi:hypothetical protein
MRPYQPGGNIFETSSDTRFNSFSSPSAMAYNQQNGQWGLDVNQATPAYTAAYRPKQNINQGDPSSPRPGFGQSLNQVLNPFASGGTNYGGNTARQIDPYYDTLGYNPLDTAASISQKWVVPGFASWLSYKYLAKPLGELGSRMAGGAVSGIIGGGLRAGEEASLGRIAGAAGRLAGGVLGPMAVAQVGVWAADKAVFDPYVALRQTTNDLRRNFAGVTFAGGGGNTLTGKGYSREEAGIQATQIGQIGAKDFALSMGEVSKLTDLSARSGLLDTVQGSQVADRMKSITKQVKMVMQIGNTSDFKEAIEVLSKLQTAGVGTKDVTSVVTKLGGMASVAGVSLQKMMATVGAQGEYLFASNGLNPYAGQLTAANAYGAFSAAQRTGLMSPALLARMGGVEGATQSATGALLGMAQTPYAGMSAYNKYIMGGSAGDVVGNVSKFSGAMARGGLSAIGTFEYTRAQAASRSLEEDGQFGQMKQLLEIARNVPGAMINGQIDAGAAFKILQEQMKLSEPQARAFVESQRVVQDPKGRAQIKAGLISSEAESRIKWLESEGYGSIFSVVTRPVHVAMHEAQASMAISIGHGQEILDSAIDSVEGVFNSKLISKVKGIDTTITQANLDKLYKDTGTKLDFSDDNSALISAVSDAYNDDDVKAALKEGDVDGLKSAIAQLDNIPSRIRKDPKKIEAIINLLLQKKSQITDSGPAKPTLQQNTRTKTKEDADKVLALSDKISTQNGKFKKGDLAALNDLIGTRYKPGDEVEAQGVISDIALKVGSDSSLTGTSADIITNTNRLAQKNANKKQQDQFEQSGARGAASLNFDSLNLAMSKIARVVDSDNVMRVRIAGNLPTHFFGGKFTPKEIEEYNRDNNVK